MKKLLIFITAIFLVFAFTACDDGSSCDCGIGSICDCDNENNENENNDNENNNEDEFYTVIFNSNGGSYVERITHIESGDRITEPNEPNMIEPDCYELDGWYKDEELKNKWDFNTDVVTSNITLYAKWNLLKGVGDTGPGTGIIFYLDPKGFIMTDTGKKAYYLEAAPEDIATTLSWSINLNFFENKYGTDIIIGAGRKNTAFIFGIDPVAPVTLACRNATYGGKTDWFCPSKDELNQLNINRNYFNNFKPGAYYWTSSQSDPPEPWIMWVQYFTTGSIGTPFRVFMDGVYNIRAIRAF